MRLVALTLAAFVLLGIARNTNAAEEYKAEIRVGDSGYVSELGMTIEFLEVVTDTRCPSDAKCSTLGEARIKIRVNRYGKTRVTKILSTAPAQNSAEFGDCIITLRSLAPYPTSDRANHPPDIAELSVKIRP